MTKDYTRGEDWSVDTVPSHDLDKPFKKKQGFATFEKDKLREVSIKGGKTKTKKPKGFAYLKLKDPKKLKEASAKGGSAPRVKKQEQS